MHSPERALRILVSPERRSAPSPVQRVVYELARLRVADRREPPRRFAHLAHSHD